MASLVKVQIPDPNNDPNGEGCESWGGNPGNKSILGGFLICG